MGPAYMAWGVKLALAGAWLAAACMVMVPASAAEPPSTPAEFYVSSSQVGGIPSEDVNGCGTTVLLPCRTLGFAWEQYVAEDTIATFFLRSGSYEVPFQPNSTAVSPLRTTRSSHWHVLVWMKEDLAGSPLLARAGVSTSLAPASVGAVWRRRTIVSTTAARSL